MKTVLKAIGIVAAVVLAIVGANTLLAAAGIETPLNGVTQNVTNAATNAVIDASGVKDKAQDALEANAGAIAEKTGLPVSSVNEIIDDIDIASWEATSLPAGATETGERQVTYGGMDATVTTYDDPSVVTVNVGGAEVTLAVPPNAQGYLNYLDYL